MANLVSSCRFAPRVLPLVLVLALAAGQLPGLARGEEGAPPEPPDMTQLETVLAKKHPQSVADLKLIQDQVKMVVDKVIPYTVGVQIGNSHGSGVIISKDGYVLTAGHVSGKPGLDAVFILHDGRKVKGKTLGVNHRIDSGLMKITDPGPWPFAPMAKPENMKGGQWVISTGHPGGYIEGRSPVVRLGRVLFTNRNVVCTDCTLVGGDSGGPLWDMDGQVVGIHSRIGWQITTNFHVPISTYKETWDRLVAGEMWGGTIEDGAVGVRPLLGAAGDATAKPCKIRQVFPGSPAQSAGLIAGDVIKKFGGADVANFNDLAKLMQEKQPGEKIALNIKRGDQELTLDLTLGGRHQEIPGGLDDEEED